MKIITKPAAQEESHYYCDFTGKKFDHFGPSTELKLEFNYGSEYDKCSLELHLSNEATEKLLDFIAGELTGDSKIQLARRQVLCRGGICDRLK